MTITENAIIDINSRPWHSPAYVLWSLDRLQELFGETIGKAREFQKVRESRAVAILLLGIHQLQGIHYMMQVSEDSSPDIRSIRLIENSNHPVLGEIQDVEVVTYGKYSSEEVTDFIINKKLMAKTSKKAYDDKTIILCEVTRQTKLLPYQKMNKKLNNVNPKPTVFVLGKVNPEPDRFIYQICQIWPEVDYLTNIDVFEQAKNYPKPHNLMLKPGPSQKVTYTPSEKAKPTPFEVFGLDERAVRQKFTPTN